jgi:hypothetical protein
MLADIDQGSYCAVVGAFAAGLTLSKCSASTRSKV